MEMNKSTQSMADFIESLGPDEPNLPMENWEESYECQPKPNDKMLPFEMYDDWKEWNNDWERLVAPTFAHLSEKRKKRREREANVGSIDGEWIT